MAAPQFHSLLINRQRFVSDSAVALRFAVPAQLSAAFSFVPGQYVTLKATINGVEERRSYSICSSSTDQGIEVGIKPIDDGVFSQFAKTLQAGDTLDVMVPQGQFVAPLGGQHDYLLVAAGSGITPCLSIATSVLCAEPNSSVSLIYANQSTQAMMFREDIVALKDRYLDRLQLSTIMSREPQSAQISQGRLDDNKWQALLEHGVIEPSRYDAVYLCGPFGMIETASAFFKDQGINEKALRTELFVVDASTLKRPLRANPVSAPTTGTPVDITLDGRQQTVYLKSDDTVLSAARRAGLDVPFSCSGGMCCTCRCKITSGEAQMDINYSLADWEEAAGFTLACQARPTSASLAVDFDTH
jgi:ring-1,2-phenylacetyl-CoA epoxidase subunit PaaE